MGEYLELLRREGAGVPWLTVALARVVLGMSVVSTILLVRRSGYGYDSAGLTAAVQSLGVAAATPIWGRRIDRRGPGRILTRLGLGYGIAMVVLALVVVREFPLVVVFVAAGCAGILFPPVSAVARVGWRRLYGLAGRDRAFALDSVTTEVGFVTGPILAAGLVDLVAPWVAVVVAGAIMAGAATMFARAPLVAGIPGTASTLRGGALRVPAVRVLMAVFAFIGVGFGTIDILAPAVAEANGHPEVAGVLLGAFAAGSAIGGLVYGMGDWPGTRHRRLQALTALMVGSLLSVGLVLDHLVWFGLVACVAGLVIAPSVVIIFALVDDLAPTSVVTEALSWILTAVTAGAAIGSGLAGQMVEGFGLGRAVVVGASVIAFASVTVTMSRRTLTAAPLLR